MQPDKIEDVDVHNSCLKRGLIDDPETRLTFPSPAVVCHVPKRPASIAIDHQLEYCLCANYVNCPVFQGKAAAPVSAAAAAENDGLNRAAKAAIPLLFIGLFVVAGLFLNGMRQTAVVPPDSDQILRVDVEDAGPDIFAEVTAVETLAGNQKTATPTPEGFVLVVIPDEEAPSLETPTVRLSATPRPTQTPLSETSTPTATATDAAAVTPTTTRPPTSTSRRATATPNFAATQAVINRIVNTRAAATANAVATQSAESAAATWEAAAAQQTTEARQATQTATAAQAQAAAAEATRQFWNNALTQTAVAVSTSDMDGDGFPDSEDSCPQQYGIPEFGGCNPFEGPPDEGDGRGDGGGDGGDGRD